MRGAGRSAALCIGLCALLLSCESRGIPVSRPLALLPPEEFETTCHTTVSLDVALPFGADVEDVVQGCRRDTPPCARLSCKGPAAIRCEPHALIDAQTAVCFARSEGMRGLDRPSAELTYDTRLRRIVWQVRVTSGTAVRPASWTCSGRPCRSMP